LQKRGEQLDTMTYCQHHNDSAVIPQFPESNDIVIVKNESK